MKIYCINLKRSVARHQNMKTQFERFSMPFEFINAVDGRKLSDGEVEAVYDKWRTRFCHGKDLSRGEIGCALSHVEFYRRVIEENVPGFVFEDDVELGPEVKRALEKVESFLADSNNPRLVQLPGLERDLPHGERAFPAENFIKVSSAMGAYAYGVNPAAAVLLLKSFSPIKFPVDYYEYLVKNYGLEIYVYNKKTISVDMLSGSTVGLERFKKYKGIGWLCYKLWRLVGKTIDVSMFILEKRKN